MAVIRTTDDELRHLVYKHPYMAVKYHNDSFRACQELYPQYEKLSNQKKYKQIVFVRIDADENLIAKRIIEKDVFSFMSIYKNGLLVESQTISSPADIKSALNKLLDIID
jgi:thioredoxin 1